MPLLEIQQENISKKLSQTSSLARALLLELSTFHLYGFRILFIGIFCTWLCLAQLDTWGPMFLGRSSPYLIILSHSEYFIWDGQCFFYLYGLFVSKNVTMHNYTGTIWKYECLSCFWVIWGYMLVYHISLC